MRCTLRYVRSACCRLDQRPAHMPGCSSRGDPLARLHHLGRPVAGHSRRRTKISPISAAIVKASRADPGAHQERDAGCSASLLEPPVRIVDLVVEVIDQGAEPTLSRQAQGLKPPTAPALEAEEIEPSRAPEADRSSMRPQHRAVLPRSRRKRASSRSSERSGREARSPHQVRSEAWRAPSSRCSRSAGKRGRPFTFSAWRSRPTSPARSHQRCWRPSSTRSPHRQAGDWSTDSAAKRVSVDVSATASWSRYCRLAGRQTSSAFG